MNISQIKSEIGIEVLNISRQKDESGVPQPWVSHWDNTRRIRVTMHDDVFALIMKDKSYDKLAIKTTLVPATPERGEYTRYVVITPVDLLATL